MSDSMESYALSQLLGTDICEIDDMWIEERIFTRAEEELEEKKRNIVEGLIGGCPALAAAVEALKMEEKIKLVLDPKIMKGIGKKYEFVKAKDGDFFRMLVVDKNNPKGIAAQAGFKIEELPKGIDPVQIAQIMQGMAIQKQLRDLSEDIREISMAVNEILAGQHHDRLAKFYAGAALYKESLGVLDESMRRSILNSALTMLSESYMELMLTLKNDTEYLCSKYNEKGNYFEVGSKAKQRELISKINSSFECIHRCAALKTAIYYKEGEYVAAVTVMQEYKSFLEKCLPKEKAIILARADVKENKAMGVWGERVSIIPERVNSVIDRLNDKEGYCLEFGLEDRNYGKG